MSESDYLAKAAKYRQVAESLPPNFNFVGQQGRSYYLQQAEHYERLAQKQTPFTGFDSVAAAITAPAAPRPGPAPAPKPPTIQIKNQARCHSYLAVAVLARKDATLHRAFAIWLTIERGRQNHFNHAELLQFIADKVGGHHRNIRRWLAAGDGIFWHFGKDEHGKRLVTFAGKDSVFRHFRLPIPGNVQFIESEKLLGQLGLLRSHLLACFVAKESIWASRATIANATGIPERTQRHYDGLNGQKKQATFLLQQNENGGEARQMPNLYRRLHFTPTKHTGKRYGLYTLELNPLQPGQSDLNQIACVNVNEKPKKRLLFENARTALQAVTRRVKRGDFGCTFSILETTTGGKLLLKAYGAT